jgi:aminoglycoside phosphotransferase (APT) family kinase protein
VQQIAPHSKLLRTWPLQGGISAQMTAFAIAQPDGQTQKMIVRQPNAETLHRYPQAAANEFNLLQFTQAVGLATQNAYYLDESGTIFATPYLVIEYIEGKPEFAPVHLTTFTRQCATHLARIHQVDITQVDLSFLPNQAVELTALIGQHAGKRHAAFAERRLRDTLAAAWPLPQRNASVLRHGDFWPGNLLWQNEELVAVIDWEDAQLGDPLTDLAISRLDMLCIFGVEAMQSFTQHYQALMTLDLSTLPYWDLYAALRFVRLAGADLAAWAAFYPPFGRPDVTAQSLMAHYQFFITQALARLATQ